MAKAPRITTLPRIALPNHFFFCTGVKAPDDGFPEEPTTCCMSGCANCVWLEYAEKLSKYYQDSGDKALKKIDEKVTDPNMRAFILHELRMRKQNQI